MEKIEKVRVVGIDEWAWKKGCSYGTILVDLERHQPIELLADRNAQSAAQWFKDHPSIEIISRDRGPTYIEAANTGAPKAQQVADRWHILHNLIQTLERFFHNKVQLLKTAALAQSSSLNAASKEVPQTPAPVPAPRTNEAHRSKSEQTAGQARLKRRQELYRHIHNLRDKNQSVAAIARQLKISRPAVYAYLKLKEPPQPTRIQYSGSHLIDPYKPYLIQRWNEGCRNAQQLWHELTLQGYTHSARTVERFVGQLRQHSGTAYSFKAVEAASHFLETGENEQRQPLSARQAAHLLVQSETKHTEWQKTYLKRLAELDHEVSQTIEQVDSFTLMLRHLKGEQELDKWLEAVEQTGVGELQNFAKGLRKDYQAVKAGLSLEWSQGQTEAQVGRLKAIKRQLYGQAGFELLRKRVLYRELPSSVSASSPKADAPVAA